MRPVLDDNFFRARKKKSGKGFHGPGGEVWSTAKGQGEKGHLPETALGKGTAI